MSNTSDISKLLQQIGAKPSYFSISSRFRNIATSTIKTINGEDVVYLQRRFIPKAEKFHLLEEYSVIQEDRIDNIAHQYLSDPERFWQICDANEVFHPDELTAQPGDKIKITLPEGIPGNTYA